MLASRATKYLDRTPLVAVDAASTAKVDHRRVAKLQSVLRARHDSSTPSPPANTADGHTLLKKPLRLFHSTIRRSSQRSSAASPDGPRRGLFSLGRRLSHQKFVDEADAADVSLGGV
jgi:hypothetical protein